MADNIVNINHLTDVFMVQLRLQSSEECLTQFIVIPNMNLHGFGRCFMYTRTSHWVYPLNHLFFVDGFISTP